MQKEIFFEDWDADLQSIRHVKEDWDADLQPIPHVKEDWDADLQPIQHVKEDWDADLEPIQHVKEDWDADLEPIQQKTRHSPLCAVENLKRSFQKQSEVTHMPLHPELMKRRRALKYGLYPDVFRCPYNKSHSIDWEKATKHLMKCRELPGHRNSRQAVCPLVEGHVVPEPEMEFHLLTCPGDLYQERTVTRSTRPGVPTGGQVSTPNYHLPDNFTCTGSRWV